jgi:DNA-binding NarL/FixJ family response regulator
MIGEMVGAVLVVDDDPVFRSLARRMLRAAGLNVVGEAETVAAAIAVAHQVRPEAALVDVGLPDGDGITLAGLLTALPLGLRVVLTSTDPDAASAKDELPNAPLKQLLAA